MDDVLYEIWSNGSNATISLLESLIKDAYKRSCFGDWSALDEIKVLHQQGAFYLYQVCFETISHNLIAGSKTTEIDVYEWFDANYKYFLNDQYRLVNVHSDPKNIPDRWIMNIFDGEQIPVECKKGKFDKKALTQLQRYMDFYKSLHGIAVGSEVTCELPDNITFIRHGIR